MRSGKPKHKDLAWRNQTVTQEWAVTAACEELIHRGHVAAEVDSRTGGRCYWPDCDGRIVSYPHAIPSGECGVHHAINRAGVCTVHRQVVHRQHDPHGEARRYLQEWLITWYGAMGIPEERWRAMASGDTPVQNEEVAVGD